MKMLTEDELRALLERAWQVGNMARKTFPNATPEGFEHERREDVKTILAEL